jgi:hypothetical protein
MALRIIFSQALRSAGESAFRNTTAFASSEMTDLPRDCASKFPSSAQDLAQPSAGRSFPEASFPTSGKNQGYIAEMPRAKWLVPALKNSNTRTITPHVHLASLRITLTFRLRLTLPGVSASMTNL